MKRVAFHKNTRRSDFGGGARGRERERRIAVRCEVRCVVEEMGSYIVFSSFFLLSFPFFGLSSLVCC
jgi:hypothetical protein